MTTTTKHYGPAFKTRLDLMGIRFMTEPNPDGAGAGSPPAEQVGTPPANDAPWTKENFDPDRAWKLVENLRNDLAANKTATDTAIEKAAEKARKDALADLAKALGGGEQQETDPVKLAERVTDLSSQIAAKDGDLTKAQADVKAANLSTTVAILAPALGANTKLLLTNEEFKTSIASVEPTDEAAVTAAITKALQANAALKQPPTRSGAGEHTGPTVQSLETLLAAAEKSGNAAESIILKRRIAELRAKS